MAFTWKIEVIGRIEAESAAGREQRPGDGRHRFGGALIGVARTPEGAECKEARVGARLLAGGDEDGDGHVSPESGGIVKILYLRRGILGLIELNTK